MEEEDTALRKKWVGLITIASVLSCLLWVVGLGWVVTDYFSGPVSSAIQPVVPAEGAEMENDGFRILALGDSLTRGTGDSEGKGYVGYLIDHLKEKSDQNINLFNFGIKGLTSDELAEQMKQPEIQRQIQEADVILITIGGNDLFRGGQTLVELDLEHVKEIQEDYTKNITSVLSNSRSLNTQATIFLIGLYNPFIELGDAETISKIVRDWNYQSAEVSASFPKTVFVPTFDLFQLNVDDYLYTDKFHPNTEGYRLIAERVASLITW
jgi:lysophospholipase L1-like esterase